jgi:DNA anti-recombination protein RmuC
MDPGTLIQYGALGVLTLSSTSVAAVLWKRLTKLQDAHTAKLEEIGKTHKAEIEALGKHHAARLEAITSDHKTEMRQLMERLIETHSSQMREYHKLAENMTNVLDSMSRKFDRSPRRLGGG